MIRRLLTNPMFMMGFLFNVAVLAASFYFDTVLRDTLPNPEAVKYTAEGLPLYHAPFPPSVVFPFGSDADGYPMHYKLIEGAKYTIGLAFIITVLRMFISVFLGITLRKLLSKIHLLIKGLNNSFHFAPLSLIAYFIVAPVALIFSWSFSSETEILFTIWVLTLLAVPTLTLLISSEMDQILKYEFIQNVKVFGGGYFHVLRKHVRPFLTPKILLLFTQQMVQVLLLFAHLGVLGVYIGGPDFKTTFEEPDYMYGETEPELVTTITSLSNEWGGLIAIGRKEFLIYPWQLYGPAAAFAITFFAFVLMTEGVKRAMQPEIKSKKRNRDNTEVEKEIDEEDFNKAANE
jgi:peptide/nickel transport system permease protein